MSSDERLPVLDRILADPPRVHLSSDSGVWQTDRDCYEFMARTLPRGAATLETGLGVSTLLFALWGCKHTCVVGSQGEVERFRAYCAARSISLDGITIEVGFSQDVLPMLSLDELDLVLIDGGHGFPTPVIDWFYGCRTLKVGGTVIVDDMQIPAVSDFLGRYLQQDPAWVGVEDHPKWAAFQRTSSEALGGEWTTQRFLGAPRQSAVTRVKVSAARALSTNRWGAALVQRRAGR